MVNSNQESLRKIKGESIQKNYIKIIRKILKDREEGREIMNSQGVMGSLNSCIHALSKCGYKLVTFYCNHKKGLR